MAEKRGRGGHKDRRTIQDFNSKEPSSWPSSSSDEDWVNSYSRRRYRQSERERVSDLFVSLIRGFRLKGFSFGVTPPKGSQAQRRPRLLSLPRSSSHNTRVPTPISEMRRTRPGKLVVIWSRLARQQGRNFKRPSDTLPITGGDLMAHSLV